MEARSRLFAAAKIKLLFRLLGALALVALAYLYWPPPELHTVERRASALDGAMPRFQFAERHELAICAPPERIWSVLHTLPGEEIFLIEPLVRVRTLNFAAPDPRLHHPLIDVAQRYGLVVLTEDPSHELVMGIAGRLWRLHPTLLPLTPRDPEAFAQLPVPGAVKAALAVTIEPQEDGCPLVAIETRVFAEQDALTEFAAYWRVIYPAGALLRHSGLEAVRLRAEALTKVSK
jgi:hypothetical protein